ncbi:MAG: gluconolactonase [Clostridiales bacterium]|jgi:DNA-binding beta-propeller fold protein YncE|nr:gluconolactonase [Clostridiales bacterium]
MFKNVFKIIISLALAIILVTANFVVVFADTPYQGYTYNFWGYMVPSPAAYAPVRSFGLSNMKCGGVCGLHDEETCALETPLTDPTDMHVDSQENIYVVDWGNNRIIVFDMDLNLNRVIDGYYRDGEWVGDAFNRPFGVYVSVEMEIYIADNQNNRVVILDEENNFLREITAPQVEGLEDNFVFLPMHVLVDRGGRVFVIVQRVFEGIMSFNADGEFLGYFGTIEVPFNPLELFWRFVMTDEQNSRQNRFIPREFQSMDIDRYGFVYTTHVENNPLNNQVMRLNPRGEDVLVNFNENVVINGDQGWRNVGERMGPSIFVDVIARSHGMYSTLCSVRGRIYTYDSEGNLLYVFAGPGNLEGMTRRPVTIEVIGDDFLLLDAHGHGRIIQYAPTDYGNLINSAISLRYDGHEQQAVEIWRQLTVLDENFALAWSGIGRSMLAAGNNVGAMEHLEHGMDIRYYSVAFRRNRIDVMQQALPNFLTAGMVLVAFYAGYRIFRSIKKGGKGDDA